MGVQLKIVIIISVIFLNNYSYSQEKLSLKILHGTWTNEDKTVLLHFKDSTFTQQCTNDSIKSLPCYGLVDWENRFIVFQYPDFDPIPYKIKN